MNENELKANRNKDTCVYSYGITVNDIEIARCNIIITKENGIAYIREEYLNQNENDHPEKNSDQNKDSAKTLSDSFSFFESNSKC